MTLPHPSEWPTTDPVAWPSRDLLAERAAVTPDRTALVDAATTERYTYRDLDARVARLAARLDERAPADAGRIGLLLHTRPAVVETFFATVRTGRTLVPLNLALPSDDLADQCRRADVDLLVCGRETESTALAIAGSDIRVASVDAPDDDGVSALSSPRDVAEAPPSSDETTPFVTPSAAHARDAEHLVLFTSGTTGTPKGVRLTASNLVASAVGSAARLGVEPDERWLVPLPTYHMGGLAPILRSTLYGTTAVLQRSFDARGTARAIDDHDVTGVSMVPTMVTRLLDDGWTPPPSLRFVLLGGAATPESLLARCERHGVPVYPTYGTTETASQIATATPEEAFDHPGTVGRPLDGTTVHVDAAVSAAGVDDARSPAEAGDVLAARAGELVVSGPTVSPGYLDDDRTDAAFEDGAFHTGDVGYRDDDGRLWVVGRVDDRIVTGGENVHPAHVAEVLRDHPDVEDAAVVGLDDPEWGQRVAALVVAADLDRDALDVHCRDRLADFQRPKTVAVADALPRTASGTVDREAVRERLREATDA